MRVQPFSLVIVLIALLACFLCVSQILRHQMLPGGGLKRYRNQPGSRSQTFSRNPQNLVLSHIKAEQGKDKPLPLQWATKQGKDKPTHGRPQGSPPFTAQPPPLLYTYVTTGAGKAGPVSWHGCRP